MDIEKYKQLKTETERKGARLIAVSKTKPVEDIKQLFDAGQRLFGENKVQEMVSKYEQLPKEIEWHLIGHLQSNKVKYAAPFVSLIHSIDSLKLLQEVNRQAIKCNRVIDCLLQIFIASEETKFGLNEAELFELLEAAEFKALQNVRICGLMGMASNTEDEVQIENEFKTLKGLFEKVKAGRFAGQVYFKELSMGMSSDYQLALKHGATLVRVGSIIFGNR
jgi:pyridoxal phosphate enzyme (YggS family)